MHCNTYSDFDFFPIFSKVYCSKLGCNQLAREKKKQLGKMHLHKWLVMYTESRASSIVYLLHRHSWQTG